MSHQASPINVLLVEEHRLFREGLRAVIEASDDCRIAGEAAGVDEALRILHRTPVDVVIVDLRLFSLTGPEGLRTLTKGHARLRVLVLSLEENDSASVLGALRTGAHGMLPKNTTGAALLDAIRSVARGGVYLGPHVAERLFSSIRQGHFDRPQQDPELGLAPREAQLLRLIASGKSSKEIALLLDLSVQTVRTYRKNLMKKLGVGNAAGLTRLAMLHGLIGPKMSPPE